jgi:hypothetical protein
VELIPLPIDRPKWGTALPAKLKSTFRASHLITARILLNIPPAKSIRTTFASLSYALYVGPLVPRLLGVHGWRRRSGSSVVFGACLAGVVGNGRVIDTVRVPAGYAGKDGVVL